MKYLQIQVDVQAVQMKTVVVEARDLDVDEVDVYVHLLERKEIHLVLETDTNLVQCSFCKVHLCVAPEQHNCFLKYHAEYYSFFIISKFFVVCC